jgi:hypothetical protein
MELPCAPFECCSFLKQNAEVRMRVGKSAAPSVHELELFRFRPSGWPLVTRGGLVHT